jgi:hypothetical protein
MFWCPASFIPNMFYPLLTFSSKSNLVGQSLKKKLEMASTVCMTTEARGEIHSRQFARNLEVFVQCYSLSRLPSYLYTSFVFLVVEFSTSTADDGEGGFVYIFLNFECV